MAADERVRGVLLAGLALAVLAVGVWWWRDSAPVVGAVDASPSPSTRTSPEHLFLVDPDTGQVLPGPELDPDEAVVVQQEPDVPPATVVSDIWVARSHLLPGDAPLVQQAARSPGERHLLTVSCTGSGMLAVTFTGSEEDDTPLRTTCPARLLTQPLTASGGPLLVRFTVADGEVDLDARLVAQG
ncbi:hypothetical protein [Micromonospora eburnea]|uniref:Uncharacterized protein n=1 Tax=Micromonospora eburnea TaxID=227316 RepID=A0A1C6VN79_9ACTN|nr:hypothetical protein [Micromonospora eburnea]SCL67360.1 hypothetical protein GA0070604_5965 [Micromonospora eburnea]